MDPLVSVVIAARNAAPTLQRLLRSLEAQDYPEECLEIIVVDNGSSDDTAAIAKRCAGVILVNEPRPGCGHARQAGMKVARGSIVACTDADCVADPGWIRALVRPYGDPSVGLVSGRILSFSLDLPLERLVEQQQLLCQERFIQATPLPVSATANLSMRRDALQQVGGFRVDLPAGEDFELCWRIQKQLSCRLVYAADAVIRHQHRQSYAGLFLQSLRDASCWPMLRRLMPGFTIPPPAREHVRHVCDALAKALTYPWHKSRDRLVEPWFLTVHYVGYGVGYLKGLLLMKQHREER